MEARNRTRLVEAMDALIEFRNQGENVASLLDEIAEMHTVPVGKLRELAEKNWGAPLETDRERNAEHFESVARHAEELAQLNEQYNSIMADAKTEAINVWKMSCPDGEPIWRYCAERLLKIKNVDDKELSHKVIAFFSDVGRDYKQSVSLYKKLLNYHAPNQ